MVRSRIRLRRLDQNDIPSTTGEIRLFVKAKDESLRLPWFLDYYFGLGVDRIFIIDNGSSDSTRELALERPKVHLFGTHEPFSRYANWLQILIDKYGTGSWCVVVDVDEMLIVPPPLRPDVREFTRFLESSGAQAMRCLLLDMYPPGLIADYAYEPGQNPLESANMYDSDFDDESFSFVNAETVRRYETRRYSGGMRRRVFGVDPNLSKVPLFQHGAATWLAPGAHSIDGATITDVRSALLHFKYLEDFVGRTVDGARSGQYAGGSSLLKPIAESLQAGTVRRLDSPESQCYYSAQDLVDQGMILVSDGYKRWCRSREEHSPGTGHVTRGE